MTLAPFSSFVDIDISLGIDSASGLQVLPQMDSQMTLLLLILANQPSYLWINILKEISEKKSKVETAIRQAQVKIRLQIATLAPKNSFPAMLRSKTTRV